MIRKPVKIALGVILLALIDNVHGEVQPVALGVAGEIISIKIQAGSVAEGVTQLITQNSAKSGAVKRMRIVVEDSIEARVVNLKMDNVRVIDALCQIAATTRATVQIDESGSGFVIKPVVEVGPDMVREYYLSEKMVKAISLPLVSSQAIESRLWNLGIYLNVDKVEAETRRLVLRGRQRDLKAFEILGSAAGLVNFSALEVKK
ncbi:MAG: hypothetical protein WCK77_24000 [Verrucomicrobiota bacterium]